MGLNITLHYLRFLRITFTIRFHCGNYTLRLMGLLALSDIVNIFKNVVETVVSSRHLFYSVCYVQH